MSARALNRATLARQLLLQRERLSVVEAVRQVMALQAQFAPSPYVALWNRIEPFDPCDLDDAFNAGTIVKSNAVRMTLHAVHADDHRVFREAVEPSIRGARLGDARFTVTGMSAAEADALVPEILDHASEPRTSAAMTEWLADRLGAAPHKGVWWALRQYAPLLHAPTGGAWSFGTRTSYLTPRDRPVLADADVSADALRAVALRYLAAFGPATIADFALFAMVQRSRARTAMLSLSDELWQLTGPSGEALFDIPGAPLPDADTLAPPRLLGMWDNSLLAYTDRSRIIPPEYRPHVTRSNGDVLPTLLVDGYVAGVWRGVEAGIEVTAFHPLADAVWEHVHTEAQSLLEMLANREQEPFQRYHHWWSKLPTGEARLLVRA